MLSRLFYRHVPPPAGEGRDIDAFPAADPRAVVAALDPAGKRVAVADPSGWIGVALLLSGAEIVPVGPSLLWLWLATAQLHYIEARQLWGLDAPGRRVWLYHKVREHIPPDRQIDGIEPAIRAGLLTRAPEDAVARRVARVRDPSAWWDADAAARADLARAWDGPRFRWAVRPLDATAVLEVLARVPLRDSPWAQRLLYGRWRSPEALPEGLQPEHHRRLAGLAGNVVPSATTADAAWNTTAIPASILASPGGTQSAEVAAANRLWVPVARVR